jgi:cyclohexadieny/prephenate dehydrogenase
MSELLFDRVAIIGIGLIGSSLARAIRAQGLAHFVVAGDASADAIAITQSLGFVDHATTDLAEAVSNADLVVICTPVATYAGIMECIAPHLKPGAILSDVGSVKGAILSALVELCPPSVQLVPGHPIAGTEQSGPASGFATLFQGRWTILTPTEGADPLAVERVSALWRGVGSQVALMDPLHHDMVLAITSHLPHLIAYTIVGTATDLEDTLQSEVIKYSASGFRDFTRIAASDPTMWRDIFLNNRDAVLDMLQRFTEDLSELQRAIRRGEGDFLFDRFTRARTIRRGVIDAKQA